MPSQTATYTAHVDTFAFDHLPPKHLQPEFLFDLPELQFPERLNCASELLDKHVLEGHGDKVCIQTPEGLRWTFSDLQERANRIAHVLVQDMGMVAGNRVLLRAPNNAMLVACWFAIIKAGGIAVATMPMLRAKELQPVLERARVTHALCDGRLAEDLLLAQAQTQGQQSALKHIMLFDALGKQDHAKPCDSAQHLRWLEAAMQTKSAQFNNVATSLLDTCIIAFTSGTTGQPKGTMHFHRDVMAACACWPRHVLRATPDDVFMGSPPLAFTFGLGGLVLFPFAIGASTVLLEQATPAKLVPCLDQFGVTVLFTAPTSYRAICTQTPELAQAIKMSKLRKCVSAGEALPAATRQLWRESTGIELIDGIGSTELLHIFISADETRARAGATGTAVPGYVACVMDDAGQPAPVGTVGKLAIKGPTGCRYLNDERQAQYVKNGWNYTGDAYLMDQDGYFHYQSRTDDMIVSAGYNIAAPEVEQAVLQHAAVAECAVIGVPNSERGQIVKAFVVLKPHVQAGDTLVKDIQDFVKQTVAPYKYPREVAFVDTLPRTETGKLQRFKLKDI